MTNEVNKLEITTSVDGKYKNIDLDKMGNGDSIIVTKTHDIVKRTPKVGTKFDPEAKWTMCQTQVEYNGTTVGFFLPRGYGIVDKNTEYIDNTKYADEFDKTGKANDKIKISLVKGLGTNKKGKDIAVKNWSFELVK